ncbi:interferon-stimulated 20 kDa exonuclease-like 2, partial [Oxyura jamaicensis]|uniref:interferon-stimulated 20 kDa exonuclease-like 2 n=1 Tax=Oxyura jamaicensis TaxID=8884 RepID=UPI0015A565DB
MSELILNVSFALSGPPRRPPTGNRRHRSFIRRRRHLERLGALKEKQLPPNVRRRPKGDPKNPGAGGEGRPGGGGGRRDGPKWRRPPSGGGAAPERGTRKGSGEGAKAHKGSGGPPKASGAPPKGSGDPPEASGASSKASGGPPKASGPPLKGSGAPPAPCKLVAIDCEMVGTGPGGRTSALARCSIVGYEGDVLYDRYVRPAEPVVDYRTRWSGVRRQHLANAVPFGKAQREVGARGAGA